MSDAVDVHRVVLSIIDHDQLGDVGVREVIESTRYPNHCIAPRVVSIRTRAVVWRDDHPLNRNDTASAEIARLFADPPVANTDLRAALRDAVTVLNEQDRRATVDKAALHALAHRLVAVLDAADATARVK